MPKTKLKAKREKQKTSREKLNKLPPTGIHHRVFHHARLLATKVPLTWFTVSVAISLGLLIFLLSLFLIIKDLPTPANLTAKPIPQTTKIFDRHGKLLYNIYVSENRTVVPLTDIPKHVQQATIAVEDRDFYRHGGINFVGGIVRAIKDMIIYRKLEGGSTITQQLIKTSLLTPERTIRRKIKEVVLAFWTERLYSKEKILWMYLNRIPYGGTAYGAEEAAQIHFAKKARELTLAEGALLAGLPAAPTYYSPFGTDPNRAILRQHKVLDLMVESKFISQDQAAKAKTEKLTFTSPSAGIKAPHFVAYVKELLVKKYGEEPVEKGGLRVTTTLDLDLQEAAQASLSAAVEKQKRLKVGNGAALVTKPGTGEILAMIGSRDYFATDGGNVNVALAERSPGSALKPFVYALGFLKGVITPATPWIDGPFCFPPFNGKVYCPQNYDGRFHGVVQTRYALGNSFNVPAVKALAFVGMDNFLATASALGITTFTDKSRYGYSLALGGGEVKMIDLATAYGALANGGFRIDLNPILKIEDNNGKILENSFEFRISPALSEADGNFEFTPWDGTKPFIPKDNYVLPQEVTYLISHILLDDGSRSTTFGSGSILNVRGQTVSVKTGTTEDKRDNWTFGYTPSHLAAVWVGNNDNSPMSPFLESGNTGAAPIWNDIMSLVLKGQKPQWPEKPENIVFEEVCALSGQLPDHDCPKRGEYFIKGLKPKDRDIVWNQKRKIWVFKDSHKQPGPEHKANQDQLMEEDHLVISDPLQRDACADCPL